MTTRTHQRYFDWIEGQEYDPLDGQWTVFETTVDDTHVITEDVFESLQFENMKHSFDSVQKLLDYIELLRRVASDWLEIKQEFDR